MAGRDPGASASARPARALAWTAVAIAVSVAVSVWALAAPGMDPIGTAYRMIEDRTLAAADIARPGPVDGQPDWYDAALRVHDGDAVQGAALIETYGCGACHTIPGIAWANGSVGPSLEEFGRRSYIAGILPMTPGNLVRWLVKPTTHAPQTAMPDMGVTEDEATDMAAYLLALGR